jgi:hypothetical protein
MVLLIKHVSAIEIMKKLGDKKERFISTKSQIRLMLPETELLYP